MRFKSYVLIGFYLTLSACGTLESWRQDKVFSDARKGRDVCGMKHLEPFIKTAFDDLTVRDYLPEKFLFRVLDPRPYLEGGPEQIVTLALVPRRQNISLNTRGNIISLECG